MAGNQSKRGGARPGAGRPKGPEAIDKALAREELRRRVVKKLRPLIDAQISNAMGIRYLVVRQKSTGKFLRRVGASDEKTHDPDTEVIEIWEKDPSVQAFTDLMNRTIDKPVDQVDMHISGGLEVITKRLEAARKRLAKPTTE